MPPLPNNENDRGADSPKGATLPKGASAPSKSQTTSNAEVELDEEFLHHGKIYGPGKMTIEDDGAFKGEDIANDLRKRQEQIRSKRRPGEAVLLPNRTITGIQPGTELDSHISNGLSPEDVAKLREEANKEAERRAGPGTVPGPRDRRATAVPAAGSPGPKGGKPASPPSPPPPVSPPPPPGGGSGGGQ
jgi:hypothetical protein